MDYILISHHTRYYLYSKFSSQIMHSSKENRLQVELINVHLQHLKGILERGTQFKCNANVRLETYTNVEYAESIIDRRSYRRSTIRLCTFFGRNFAT